MSLEKSIQCELRDSFCTIMSPSFHELIPYDLDTSREGRKKLLETLKQEKSWELQQLENMISYQMLKAFQEENEWKDCIHLNIQEKSEDENVMLFLLKKIMKEYNVWEGEILKQIKDLTILKEDILPLISNLDDYKKQLNDFIQEKCDIREDINMEQFILNSEGRDYHKILEGILKQNWRNSIQVFIDRIDNLTEIEQQQINNFLYTRGTLTHDVKAYVKINNWRERWKTWRTSCWKSVQSPHDYKSWTTDVWEIWFV